MVTAVVKGWSRVYLGVSTPVRTKVPIEMVSNSQPNYEAALLHQQMGRPLELLRFEPDLEAAFVEELRTVQHRSAIFTLVFMSVVWLCLGGFDWWRLSTLMGSGQEAEFVWGVMVQRWVVWAIFLGALYVLLQRKLKASTEAAWISLSVLACCAGVALSAYTSRSLGMPDSGIVLLLIVVVALYPLGIRLRLALGTAATACVIATVAGPLVLEQADHLAQHWMVVSMMWATLVLSAVTAYFREKNLRQQFLLRKLLDWETSHDPLTGLANRRMFREHFQRCMLHAKRQNVSLFLGILDIDHFKLYNDLYGHQAGDEVLRLVGELLQDYARRPLDLAVRLGGEEFALVAYDEDVESLRARMEKLMIDLHRLNLAHDASPTAPYVTVSVGLAQVRGDDTVDTVFKLADSLLLQAKEQGRNQVCGVASIALPVINPRRPSWAQQAAAMGSAG